MFGVFSELTFWRLTISPSILDGKLIFVLSRPLPNNDHRLFGE